MTNRGICYAFNAREPRQVLRDGEFLQTFLRSYDDEMNLAEANEEPMANPYSVLTMVLDRSKFLGPAWRDMTERENGQFKIGKTTRITSY